MSYYIRGDLVMYYIVQSYYYHICYTSNTTLYTDISTVVLSHIVLDGQWSVGFVVDNNDLTSSIDYQLRVLKRLVEVRRKWIDQQQQGQDTSLKKSTPLVSSYKDDLLVAQQNIKSLQERLLELESQQGR